MSDPASDSPGSTDGTTGFGMDEPPMRRLRGPHGKDIRRVLLIWGIVTILGIVFAFVIPTFMPSAASSEQHGVRLTIIAFTIAAAPVIAVVCAIAGYSAFAWRTKGRPTRDGPAIRGNSLASIMWMSISAVLALFLLVWGFAALQSVNASAKPQSMEIDVTGQQWVWSFNYPSQHLSTFQLVLPVNQPVVFYVTSEDVVHSFWIPNFGLKVDANPGEVTEAATTPDKVGVYPIRCAELCGLYHAFMQANIRVVTLAQFRAWVASGGGATGGPPLGPRHLQPTSPLSQ